MISIGPYTLANNVLLAPMVGVSDKPFREICSELGAGLTSGEMLTSNTELWHSEKNRLRQIKAHTSSPHVVQIAGSDPLLLANAARLHVDQGAQIIDINMGCPAKKVLKKAAGSALLKDLKLVQQIVQNVVAAVPVPVTLKIRTGWCPQQRNGVEVASIAEDCGIQLLSVHGRTRECRFKGAVEYDTIASIKQAVNIPVVANGDIDSPEKAKAVLLYTKADGVMIGRAAQGRPWIFQEIDYYLKHNKKLPDKNPIDLHQLIERHLHKLYAFYGETRGVLFARKHISCYLDKYPNASSYIAQFHQCSQAQDQLQHLQRVFAQLTEFTTHPAIRTAAA